MTERIVQVCDAAYRLMQRAKIDPPPQPGDLLDVGYVDKQLAASSLSTDERIAAKNFLRDAQLLRPGRIVDIGRR